MAPDAAGIDHHLRTELQLGMRAVVVGLHTDDAVLLADELPDFGIGADLGAVRRGVEDVRRGQPEGIDRAVGDADRADQRRIGRRLQPPGFLGIEDVGADAGLAAGLDKTCLIVEPVLGKGDEEAVGLLDTMRRDPAQDHVLADALHG